MSPIQEIIPRGVTPSLVPLLDDAEVAGALRISERHLRTLRTRRMIKFVRLGRMIRYHPADVAAAVASLTISSRELK